MRGPTRRGGGAREGLVSILLSFCVVNLCLVIQEGKGGGAKRRGACLDFLFDLTS